MLTTGWFDTKEQFEAHRRKIKSKLSRSIRADGEYEDTAEHAAYEGYRNLGGAKGGLIIGGAHGFDSSSKGGLE